MAAEWCLIVGLAIFAWRDLRTGKLPNWLLVLFSAAGVANGFITGQVIGMLGGVVAAFLLTLVPVALRGMGMGDQKLLMAIGSWVGGEEVFRLLILSCLVSLLAMAARPKNWLKLAGNIHLLITGWVSHRTIWLPDKNRSALALPFAVCLFCAYLLQLAGVRYV